MTNELYHHGVKGQRWGIRRYQPYSAKSKHKGKYIGEKNIDVNDDQKRIKKNERKEAKHKRKELVKDRRNLSDEEIRQALSRVQAEKQLKNLVESDVSPGTQAVKQILSDVGKKTLTTVLSGMAIYALSTAISGNKIDRQKLGEAALGGGKKKDKKDDNK